MTAKSFFQENNVYKGINTHYIIGTLSTIVSHQTNILSFPCLVRPRVILSGQVDERKQRV